MKDTWRTFFKKNRGDAPLVETASSAPVEPLAPNPIREQFSTGIPILKSEELRSLVRDGTSPRERPEFAFPALYLVIKGSAHDKETQMRLLQKVTDIVVQNSNNPQEIRLRIRDFVEKEIIARNDWAVDAHTLQGRIGKNLTVLEGMYNARAEALAKDTRAVFLVGHATFVGLPYFIRAFANQEPPKTLYILMPKYIAASDADITTRNEPTGIKIEHGRVGFLTAEDYAKLTEAVVIDDIKSTGATEQALQEFLTEANAHATITFDPIMHGQNTSI